MIFIATGSSRFGQITPTTPLHVNGCKGVAGSFGTVLDALKSPVRSAAVRTMAVFRNVCVVRRRHEYVVKKNVRSWTIGPPSVPPNWFRLSGGVASTEPHSFAFILPSRTYSKAEPLYLLVPDFVTTLMMPLEKRPYSTG